MASDVRLNDPVASKRPGDSDAGKLTESSVDLSVGLVTNCSLNKAKMGVLAMSVRLWKLVLPSMVALVAGISGPAFAEDVIKYGLVSAFSGPAAAWGAMGEVNDQLAIEDINAAGGIDVGGKKYKLELVKYDHAYDPTKGVTVVRQAVQQGQGHGNDCWRMGIFD